MPDPSIDAARLAWNGRYEHDRSSHDDEFDRSTGAGGIAQLAVAAAREALAPLRELHKPVTTPIWWFPAAAHGGTYTHCEHCQTANDWPCDTAKLIYPEGEL